MGAPDGFTSHWHTVRGLRLHALVSDADPGAPTAVLLPGLVTASRSMVPLALALGRRGLRTWVLDPPGFGYSDKPHRSLSMTEQAAVVADWLRAAGCTPARVLGNSFGSQVTAALAALHPGAAERVVLLSPTAGPAVRRRLSWLRALPGPTGAPSKPTGRRRAHLLGQLHDALDPLSSEPPLRLLNVLEYACASLPRAVSTVRCAVLDEMERVVPRVGVPALFIRAEHDHLSSLEWAQALAASAPDGELVRLPGLGHAAFYGAADTVAEVAGPFLAAGAPTRHGR